MTKQNVTLSWGDRFAIIDHYKPSDEQIQLAFGLTQPEIEVARNLRSAGTFAPTPNMDMSKFATVFSVASIQMPSPPTISLTTRGTDKMNTTAKTPTATTHTMPDATAKPETASKPVKTPKKRGRKGDKILNALMAVPKTQIPVDTFIQQTGVSLAVLRQAKRFVAGLDPVQAAAIGKVNVRQDKATKKLMIWREDV